MKRECSRCREENEKRSKYCHICGSGLPVLEEEKSVFEIETLYKAKRKFGIKTLLGFMVGFVVLFFIFQSFFKPSFDKRLVKMTNELNKNCPITISTDLVLKNVTVMSDKTIQYNYAFINLTKAEVKTDTLKKYMFPPILESVKSDPQAKVFRDNKITVNYHYSDKYGTFIINYLIKPEMYKEEIK